MPNRSYAYQYDTNPRKLKPDYTAPKKKKNTNKNYMKNSTKSAVGKKNDTKKSKEQDKKSEAKLINKAKFSIGLKCVILFLILFLIIFRNSQMSASFSKIQGLKVQIAEIQKENDQLEINIQNSINLSNIEQQAKELLGMQKLSNKQTVYITLPKKDYTEPRAEEIIIEENTNFFSSIINKLKNKF